MYSFVGCDHCHSPTIPNLDILRLPIQARVPDRAWLTTNINHSAGTRYRHSEAKQRRRKFKIKEIDTAYPRYSDIGIMAMWLR